MMLIVVLCLVVVGLACIIIGTILNIIESSKEIDELCDEVREMVSRAINSELTDAEKRYIVEHLTIKKLELEALGVNAATIDLIVHKLEYNWESTNQSDLLDLN